ncbi:MAG: hypothetical protein ACTHMD_13215 [Flavisolibacter sp.]
MSKGNSHSEVAVNGTGVSASGDVTDSYSLNIDGFSNSVSKADLLSIVNIAETSC